MQIKKAKKVANEKKIPNLSRIVTPELSAMILMSSLKMTVLVSLSVGLLM